MGFIYVFAASIMLAGMVTLSGSGFNRPVAASQIAKAIMGISPIIPMGTAIRESTWESRRMPNPAWALIAAWASVEGQMLPERKRSQVKITLNETVKRTIMPMPNQG